VKNAQGIITRVSVGVLINERPIPPGTKVEKPADGSAPASSMPYSPEELERLNQLVKSAVGFNEGRGDTVAVVSTKFEPQVDPNAIPWYLDENYQVMVNAAVIAVVFVLLLIFVVRPLVRRLTNPEIDPDALAAAATAAAEQEAKLAIEVATAESAAAQQAAKEAREAHEAEIARIALEAERSATAAARFAEATRRAMEEKAAQLAREREEQAQALAKAQAEALEAAERAAAAAAAGEGGDEIEIQEGETLEEVKARMASLKPKKQSISADLLNTANSYDDKVALIRMIVAEDSTRVAGVLKGLIKNEK
jgi:flagellar M-ring protein FliF